MQINWCFGEKQKSGSREKKVRFAIDGSDLMVVAKVRDVMQGEPRRLKVVTNFKVRPGKRTGTGGSR